MMHDIYNVWLHPVDCFTGKRRYDRKQQGYGGQTKQVFHKKVSEHQLA